MVNTVILNKSKKSIGVCVCVFVSIQSREDLCVGREVYVGISKNKITVRVRKSAKLIRPKCVSQS